MHSIIIVSKNQDLTTKTLNKIYSDNKIASIDQDANTFEKAVGIEDVRNVQKKLYFKPIRSREKAVVINTPQGIGIEAQNALLKILEEPPRNTFIVLVVKNKNSLLPTVLSRCKIIEMKNEPSFSEGELSELSETIESLESMGVGEKLRLAQDFGTSRDEALIFLEKMIILGRKKMTADSNEKSSLRILKEFQKIYAILKTTNATPRLTLEN
ncbi:MAG: hypothetical protein WD992_01330, partial [Candidatus Levyibacteriota bacterium]